MSDNETRLVLLQNWLDSQLDSAFRLTPLAGDASFRRYFRIFAENKTYIAMDAPPDQENCLPYIKIAQILTSQKINVPEIKAKNLDEGFLLLSDFGDNLYFRVLNNKNVDQLYDLALQELFKIQRCHSKNHDLPFFSTIITEELQRFVEWYLIKHLQLELNTKEQHLISDIFEKLISSAFDQPQTFVHRDYHSRNLMLLPNHQVGVLDFQDAVEGPITYDLVSLLKDCYIDWPISQVHNWAMRYFDFIATEKIIPNISSAQWIQWFDLMGMQRHLKAIYIFARKWHRDNNANYLPEIPRTLNYILQVTDHYPELKSFRTFLIEKVSV